MVEKHIITQSSCFINICLSDTYQDSIQKDKKKKYMYTMYLDQKLLNGKRARARGRGSKFPLF